MQGNKLRIQERKIALITASWCDARPASTTLLGFLGAPTGSTVPLFASFTAFCGKLLVVRTANALRPSFTPVEDIFVLNYIIYSHLKLKSHAATQSAVGAVTHKPWSGRQQRHCSDSATSKNFSKSQEKGENFPGLSLMKCQEPWDVTRTVDFRALGQSWHFWVNPGKFELWSWNYEESLLVMPSLQWRCWRLDQGRSLSLKSQYCMAPIFSLYQNWHFCTKYLPNQF